MQAIEKAVEIIGMMFMGLAFMLMCALPSWRRLAAEQECARVIADE